MPSAREEYLFDLRGYTVVRQALDADHVGAVNDWIDALPPLEQEQWYGNVYVHTYGGVDGTNLQDIIEGGEIFERLIDHPAWIDRVRHFLGPSTNPYIHEALLNVREGGGFIGVHSGGHYSDHHQRSGRRNGQWVCSMLSLLIPLTDVGPGDGATIIVPGSHKSDFPHPLQKLNGGITQEPGGIIEDAVELHLKAGDALLFNDALCHGSTQRTNPGQRRMFVFRYVPSLLGHRFGYVPSAELLARLTPEQRAIVQPIVPKRRPPPSPK
ncbi:MAG: phytanoyl-CoA dioxygenase family protein [Caldilineaceae bacterium]|nr:phytanoyl-CoA dioxygenase family protein [Caldilineaceae bacterium]